MEEIRVGVIGIGNMGYAHAICIVENGIKGMCLTAVCDINHERIKEFNQNRPLVKTYTDYNELLKSGKVDAVIIAVPHPLHSEIAIKAFENGLHVMLEKPADISVSRVKRLNEIAEKSGKVFGIMFNQRTNPLFKKAREIIQGGFLGELKRTVWIVTNWYRTQSYYDSGDWRATWSGEGGGVLLNQAPHNLDLWQWICGMPKSVTAFCDIAKYHNIEVEDDVTIFTRYENGATGTFITSTGEYPGTNRMEISGTKGKIVIENGTLKWWKLKTDERKVCKNSVDSFVNIETEYVEINQEITETAHKGILQNFANAILYGEELLSPGIDGIYELTISNAAYLSSCKGNVEISLPFDFDEFDRLLNKLISNSKKRSIVKSTTQLNSYNERWKVRW
jgi:predicted dehydrogenase